MTNYIAIKYIVVSKLPWAHSNWGTNNSNLVLSIVQYIIVQYSSSLRKVNN